MLTLKLMNGFLSLRHCPRPIHAQQLDLSIGFEDTMGFTGLVGNQALENPRL